MTRNLFASTAVAVLIASGAYAQTTPAPSAPAAPMETTAQKVVPANGHLASSVIGETVYNGLTNDAQNIGKVNDLVVGPDGKIQSIIVGVGGFLGIGEKNVAVDYSTLEWAERDGDRWIVVTATPEQLKAQPAFDPAPFEAKSMAANDGSTAAPVAQAPAANTDHTAAIDKSTLKPLDSAAIKVDDFVGTTVYGMKDERVGEIGEVVLQGDKVDAVVLDVGGFLGIGEKPVAVGMDDLAFMTDENGRNYLYTQFTKEQLEAAPAYDAAGYAANRDQMRLVVPN